MISEIEERIMKYLYRSGDELINKISKDWHWLELLHSELYFWIRHLKNHWKRKSCYPVNRLSRQVIYAKFGRMRRDYETIPIMKFQTVKFHSFSDINKIFQALFTLCLSRIHERREQMRSRDGLILFNPVARGDHYCRYIERGIADA